MSDIESLREKEITIAKMSAQFVHDISTPLAIIQILAQTLETYLPDILAAHQKLKAQGADIIDIPLDQYDSLESSAVKIKALTQQVNKAARDYWQKIDEQIKPTVETDQSQILKPANSISLKNRLRILIVEDDAIHQKIAFKLLSNQHKVDIAANGREAVEYCQHQSYDLVLMDLHMPVMGGQQAVIEIMKLENIPSMIVGLTNRPLGSEKRQLLQQGFSGFIEKPFNINELMSLIETLKLNNDRK